MRVLVWQWGRRGAGPRFAVEMVHGFEQVPGAQILLSLSTGAEILRAKAPPICDLYFKTYNGLPSYVRRAFSAPMLVPRLEAWLRSQRVDVALCAMPAPLDFLMTAALRRAGVPFAVVVHDAERHPGDLFPAQMRLQRRIMQQAKGLFALTEHVATGVRAQGIAVPLFMASHPPFPFGDPAPPPRAHGGKLRLLSFGRLLPYKGLDLLQEALAALGTRDDIVVRVVGSGPETRELAALRAMPGVTVENRWVPEDEIGPLLAWSDALVLSHREASQSGVVAAALAAGRWVVATRVGGLAEQLKDQPGAVLCEPHGSALAAAIETVNRRDPAVATYPKPWGGMAAQMLADLRLLTVPQPVPRPAPLEAGLEAV